MTEATADGKGQRVSGFVVFMLGAGLILESTALWQGGVVMGIGAVIFARGLFAGAASKRAAS